MKKFELKDRITEEQKDFLDEHGYLIFGGVVSKLEVATIRSELDRIERQWNDERRTHVFGVPIFRGFLPDGTPMVQRYPFTSCFSDPLRELVRDARFAPVRSLIGDDTRVGDAEKDGVVVNKFINTPFSAHRAVGWHTDGLRDIFYLRRPKPMLNVGIHLDDCPRSNGGLRVIPGTHRQGFAAMCFRKLYFLSHAPDPDEVAIETEAGDLTVHDGRLWHRVERSPNMGEASLRRTIYVPYLTDAYQPKDDRSPTPFYHQLGRLSRWLATHKAPQLAIPRPS